MESIKRKQPENMDKLGVSRYPGYQYGVDISEVVRRPDGHDLVHDREVITNYLNGPTPLGLTFDDELKMAVRRFRLKVDAHMAVEWEKARLRRAEAASKRWNRKMSQSRESGITFSHECAEMLSKVRKKIEIQMAVEKVKLTELMANQGECQYRDEAKLKDITAKMVENKFAAPLADVYCFRSVLTELKEKARGRITEKNGGNDEAVECIDNQKLQSIADACPAGQCNQNNDETVNTEIYEQEQDVLDHEVEISKTTAMKECTDLQTDNEAGYQMVELHLGKPPANIDEIGQSMPKDEPRKQISDVASHGRDYLSSDDIRAGGDGEVTKGPLNGHEDIGPADNEALDSDMDEEMKSGCWTFFSRMFRRFRKKKSRP